MKTIINAWQSIKINYIQWWTVYYLTIITWVYVIRKHGEIPSANCLPIIISRCYTSNVFSFCIRYISLNYYVLNQLLRRAHMAVSRGIIFPGSGVGRYCYDYRFRTRSLDRSLILIVVTRNKAQLQNARVHARVYASVFLTEYAQFTGASCLEYFVHPCARITHKRARDAKERRSEDERRPQMNFNEHCVIWVLFSLSLSLSRFVSYFSFFFSLFLLQICILFVQKGWFC